MKVDTTDLDKKCDAIYRDAIAGLVTSAYQQEHGYLHEDGKTRSSNGMVGEFYVEGVGRPSIKYVGEGRWQASMHRTTNPWAFTVYINETADDAVTALNAVHERVLAKDWR